MNHINIAISAVRSSNAKISRKEIVFRLQELGHKVYYIGDDSAVQEHPDFSRLGVEYIGVPIKRVNTNIIKECKTLLEVKRLLKQKRIDALIAYGVRTFPVMVTAARMVGIRIIVCVVNGSGNLFRVRGIKGSLLKAISYPMLWNSFRSASSVVFQNSDDLSMFKAKKLLPKKNYLIVNGSGVNLEEFRQTQVPREPVFLFIGRLAKEKGILEFLEASKTVKSMYPEARFLIIGSYEPSPLGITEEELNYYTEKGIVEYLGYKENVKKYIDECLVYVLPSYHEGVPRTVLEAMAVGRPIITSNAVGCREMVPEGKNGFLVPTGDSVTLTEKMIYMIEHIDETISMGIESRKICEAKYDVNVINEAILKSIHFFE